MGYGYDPEETTGQEHMDGTAPESGGQEYTDSAQTVSYKHITLPTSEPRLNYQGRPFF